nr:amidase family protein [Paraflavitalea speifideiaquila]
MKHSKGIYKGPLQGIPYGLKDLFAVRGYKTTWGSVPYKDQVIEEDAFVYTQLKKPGRYFAPNSRWESWLMPIYGLVEEHAIPGTCNWAPVDHRQAQLLLR